MSEAPTKGKRAADAGGNHHLLHHILHLLELFQKGPDLTDGSPASFRDAKPARKINHLRVCALLRRHGLNHCFYMNKFLFVEVYTLHLLAYAGHEGKEV